MEEEEVLFHSRTHPKILFKTLMIQLGLVIGYYLLLIYYPDKTGFKSAEDWGFAFLSLMFFIVEILYVVIPALKWWNETFTVTNYKIKNDWGILYKNSREIDLTRIASISEERGILDRMFSCGSLIFYDAAAGAQQYNNKNPLASHEDSTGIRFHDVPDVKNVREIIENAKHKALNTRTTF